MEPIKISSQLFEARKKMTTILSQKKDDYYFEPENQVDIY